ncbi:CBS domain-containing protein [Candidatus Riflebacteria bacterium]
MIVLIAKDIMSTEVVTIEGSATVAEAIAKMKETGLRDLIVDRRDEGDAYGILTETDVVYKVFSQRKDPREVKVHQVMGKPCVVVNPDLAVEYVARLFANMRIRRAPVIKGKLLGVISITDIVRKAL